MTAALLLSCASPAAARRYTLKDTMGRVHHASVRSRAASKRRLRSPVSGCARPSTSRRRVVHLPRAGRAITRSVAKALTSPIGVTSHSMLRPSGTAADLNPIPQLLDLGERRRDMRRSLRRLNRMARRSWWIDFRQAPGGS